MKNKFRRFRSWFKIQIGEEGSGKSFGSSFHLFDKGKEFEIIPFGAGWGVLKEGQSNVPNSQIGYNNRAHYPINKEEALIAYKEFRQVI